MAKRGLGRGLGALIPTVTRPQDKDNLENTIVELTLDKIVPNRNQPRHNFDEESINELAESIKEFGIIQPIIVRSIDGQEKYEIIAGERRYRAAKILGINTIPAIINNEVDDTSSLEIALIENIHRKNLSPIELSHTFKQLIEEFKITHEELSKRIGKSRTAITNYLRLLKLPLEVQKLVDEEKISTGHARALVSLNTIEDQIEVANLIVKRDLSVREVEKIVSKKTRPAPEIKPDTALQFSKLPNLAQKISDCVNAPVKIKVGRKKGKIEIEFGSVKDLERIVEKIIG